MSVLTDVATHFWTRKNRHSSKGAKAPTTDQSIQDGNEARLLHRYVQCGPRTVSMGLGAMAAQQAHGCLDQK